MPPGRVSAGESANANGELPMKVSLDTWKSFHPVTAADLAHTSGPSKVTSAKEADQKQDTKMPIASNLGGDATSTKVEVPKAVNRDTWKTSHPVTAADLAAIGNASRSASDSNTTDRIAACNSDSENNSDFEKFLQDNEDVEGVKKYIECTTPVANGSQHPGLNIDKEIADFKAKNPQYTNRPLPDSIIAMLEGEARFKAKAQDDEVKPVSPRARYPSGDLTTIKEEAEASKHDDKEYFKVSVESVEPTFSIRPTEILFDKEMYKVSVNSYTPGEEQDVGMNAANGSEEEELVNLMLRHDRMESKIHHLEETKEGLMFASDYLREYNQRLMGISENLRLEINRSAEKAKLHHEDMARLTALSEKLEEKVRQSDARLASMAAEKTANFNGKDKSSQTALDSYHTDLRIVTMAVEKGDSGLKGTDKATQTSVSSSALAGKARQKRDIYTDDASKFFDDPVEGFEVVKAQKKRLQEIEDIVDGIETRAKERQTHPGDTTDGSSAIADVQNTSDEWEVVDA